MNQIIYFLFGVFIGNIIDIKYVLIIYFIYVMIKNDPIYDNIYPRTIFYQSIIILTNKFNHANVIETDNSYKIVEIDNDDDVKKIFNDQKISEENRKSLEKLLMLPPPPLYSMMNDK